LLGTVLAVDGMKAYGSHRARFCAAVPGPPTGCG
jgi:hypothetical protein